MQHHVWLFNDELVPDADREKLNTYEKISALPLQKISSGPRNRMSVCQLTQKYYVKEYNGSRGGWLRSLLGKSRLENEYNNLKRFHEKQIPAPPIVAFGYRKICGKLREGVLITLEIPNTVSLGELYKKNVLLQHSKAWFDCVITQIADYTRRMHDDNFMFSDLKWRNILVSHQAQPAVYFIDCPNGVHVPRWFMWRAIIKDLACLDKVAKYALSRTQRLRFYKCYARIKALDAVHKRRIAKIVSFFEGRE